MDDIRPSETSLRQTLHEPVSSKRHYPHTTDLDYETFTAG
jgi:hypothetical protein